MREGNWASCQRKRASTRPQQKRGLYLLYACLSILKPKHLAKWMKQQRPGQRYSRESMLAIDSMKIDELRWGLDSLRCDSTGFDYNLSVPLDKIRQPSTAKTLLLPPSMNPFPEFSRTLCRQHLVRSTGFHALRRGTHFSE